MDWMPLPFKQGGLWKYTWKMSPADRAFVGHIAELEHSSVAGLLHRAVIYYADHRLKLSYNDYLQTVKLDTPNEMHLKLTLKDQRNRSLAQENAELRYQLRELKKERDELVNAGFYKSNSGV